jgi:hypothetical protein
MSELPQASEPKKTRRFRGCLGCLGLLGISAICLAGIFFLGPSIFSTLGVFGQEAEEVYEQAPDPFASAQLSQVFEERDIPGVRVYVIPIKDEPTQGAFIILDSSDGYTGLSPLADNDDVFIELLQDLTRRSRQENLQIAHVTIDFRDEQGDTAMAFTVQQSDVEAFADGESTQDEFFGKVHFDLLGTIQYLGIEEFLQGELP